MSDPLMDMVDALVTALNTQFTTEFTAAWTDDALCELTDADLQSATVWVVDMGESLSSDDSHVPMEEFSLLVVVQRKFTPSDDQSSVCKTLSDLVARITRFCRDTTIEGAVCVKTVRNPARNLADYHQLGRYYAEIQTTWRRVDDG